MTFENICIVGNIASGKSTLTQFLATAIPDSIAIPEEFDDNPFLPLFVADPPRWAFANAVRYYYDYARLYRERTAAQPARHHFIDAGGATNRYIYGNYLLEQGIVTREEHALYEVLCGTIQRDFAYPEPDAYILIHTAPETCFARMHQRGWEYQTKHITLSYLLTLDKYIAAFERRLKDAKVPLLVLETDWLDFSSPDGRAATLARIELFLNGATL